MSDKRLFPPKLGKIVKSKGNTNQPLGGSFIALGAAKSGGVSVQLEPVLATTSSSASFKPGVKRERDPSATPSSVIVPPKKPKFEGETLLASSTAPISVAVARKDLTKDELWQKHDIADMSPTTFFKQLTEAKDRKTSEPIICTLIKRMQENRLKAPEPAFSVGLAYMAKIRREFFVNRAVVEGLCSLLKKPPLKVGQRPSVVHFTLAANTLLACFIEEKVWPELFVKVYLDDALNDRFWVDRADCKAFVDTVITAFYSVQVPSEFIAVGVGGESASTAFDTIAGAATFIDFCQAPNPHGDDEEHSRDSGGLEVNLSAADMPLTVGSEPPERFAIIPRFSEFRTSIQEYTVNLLSEYWARRADTAGKGLLKTMAVCCGYSEVRAYAAARLDTWLQNAKLQKFAIELLMAVCLNTREQTQADVDTISTLTKLRLKSKSVIQQYCTCLKVLFDQHPEHLVSAMRLVVHNELTATRSVHNMLIIGQCFQYNIQAAAQILARLCIELLAQRDDCMRSLRGLLREIARTALRHEFPLVDFCNGLMDTLPIGRSFDNATKTRLFLAAVDLMCLSMLMSISPSVREIAAAIAKGERRDTTALRQYHSSITTVWRAIVVWLQQTVPAYFVGNPSFILPEYTKSFYKLLLLDKGSDAYVGKDNWPSEQERHFMLTVAGNAPIDEELLTWILVAGLSAECQLPPLDAVDLCDQIVRRAAHAGKENHGIDVLSVPTRLEIIDLLFNSCAYKPPDSILLPAGYEQPAMAVTNMYWKTWFILLVLGAHNPDSIGRQAHANYPTLRFMMEMCMTNDYEFPPRSAVSADLTLNDIKSQDLQAAEMEKSEILELESYLAAASTKVTITETNSLLLSTVTRLDPKGPARRPPIPAIEQLKILNQQLQLGLKLCSSRDPDFLLSIVNRRGASQAMPWLLQLVEAHEGSFNILPVQCLCEFLLHQIETDEAGGSVEGEPDELVSVASTSTTTPPPLTPKAEKHKAKLQAKTKKRHDELRARLHAVMWSEDEKEMTLAQQALDYFMGRLSADTLEARITAEKALSRLLANPPSNVAHAGSPPTAWPVICSTDLAWLFMHVPRVPCFGASKKDLCSSLWLACTTETRADYVAAYLLFLEEHVQTVGEDLIRALSQIFIGRRLLLADLFPRGETEGWDYLRHRALSAALHMFAAFLKQVRQPQDSDLDWCASQDLVIVKWHDGMTATLNVQIVYTIVLLLIYPCPLQAEAAYAQLMNLWFPLERNAVPMAYLADSLDEAELFPDWLKLRMLDSKDERILAMALQDLDVDETVMFLQSFGVRPNAISKVLNNLDALTERNFNTVQTAVIDRLETVVDFIKAQRARGAVGGDVFLDKFEGQRTSASTTTEKSLETQQNFVRGEGKTVKEEIMEVDTSSAEVAAVCTLEPLTAQEIDQCFQNADDHVAQSLWSRLLTTCVTAGITNSYAGVEPVLEYLQKHLNDEASRQHFVEILQQHESQCRALLKILFDSVMDKNPMLEQQIVNICQQLGDLTTGSLRAICAKLAEHKIVADQLPTEQDKMAAAERNALVQYLEGDEARDAAVANLVQLLKTTSTSGSESSSVLEWLLAIDPELVEACPSVQLPLLFGVQHEHLTTHMLALLPHTAKVATLHCTVHSVLDQFRQEFDPTKVLDFLDACARLPRLWRGREANLPRHTRPEDILCLSRFETAVFVQYLLEELKKHPLISTGAKKRAGKFPVANCRSWDSGFDETPISNSAENALVNRMPLLVQCCQDMRNLRHVVELLIRERTVVQAKLVLMELYLTYPVLRRWLTKPEMLQDIVSFAHLNTCKLDAIVHKLVMELYTATGRGASSEATSDLQMALATLADSHPTIFLRQLSAINALLRGIVSLSSGQLWRRANYILFISVMSRYVEQLLPAAFDAHYVGVFLDTMTIYFDFVASHALRNPRYVAIIDRCLAMLQRFHYADGLSCGKFLQTYASLLQAIALRYPQLPALKTLMTEVTLPLPPISADPQQPLTSGAPQDSNAELLPSNARPPSPTPVAQVLPMLHLLKKQSDLTDNDIRTVLEEIEEISAKKPDFLPFFKSHLESLMSHTNELCRELAFELMMRHLKENPSEAKDIVSTYLTCLDHPNCEVVMSALKFLPIYVALCREYAHLLMERAFASTLGLGSGGQYVRALCDTLRSVQFEPNDVTNKLSVHALAAVPTL